MIEVKNITRRFGEYVAVDNVSFNVAPGEIVGLLGHNGAGKTTLMKMITGYLEPSDGDIRVQNLDIQADTTAIQAQIGYLPENCPVYPDMTVLEYLDYQASLHRLPDSERTEHLRRAIRLTALEAKAMEPIATLSRGYRQRVGVAQAILHRPRIIILDEPTNGLDPTQIQQMRGLIHELAKESTVIISTHILQEVQAVCERVLIMRNGSLVVDSTIDELQQGSRLRVTLDQPNSRVSPVLSTLAKIISVTQESISEGLFTYSLDAHESAAPQVAEAVIQAGFKLYGLTPERRNLETLFADVNDSQRTAMTIVDKEVQNAA